MLLSTCVRCRFRVTFVEYMDGICGAGWKVNKRKDRTEKQIRESILNGIVIRIYQHRTYNIDDPIHGKDLLKHFESFDLRDGVLHHTMTVPEFADCLACAGVTLMPDEVDSVSKGYLDKEDPTRVDYRPFVTELEAKLKEKDEKHKGPKVDRSKQMEDAEIITAEIRLPENVEGSVLLGLLRDHFYAKRNDLRQHFHEADLDNSGKLSHEELNLLMCSLGFDLSEDHAKRM